jgi:hypothetical protein
MSSRIKHCFSLKIRVSCGAGILEKWDHKNSRARLLGLGFFMDIPHMNPRFQD